MCPKALASGGRAPLRYETADWRYETVGRRYETVGRRYETVGRRYTTREAGAGMRLPAIEVLHKRFGQS